MQLAGGTVRVAHAPWTVPVVNFQRIWSSLY